MRQYCQSLDEFVSHLKMLGATGMLVISMGSPVFEIASTVKSAYEVARLAESRPTWFGDGPYWIESGKHDHWEDAPAPELVYYGYAIAFSIEAKLRRDGRVIGGHDRLLAALSDYEYLVRPEPSERPDDMVRSVLIKLPTDPAELSKLKTILLEESVTAAIDDGSGEIHLSNTFTGNGVKVST